MLRNDLWIEQVGGQQEKQFFRKHCVLVPFCGLLAIDQTHSDQDGRSNAEQESLNALLRQHYKHSWICGGKLRLNSISKQEAFVYKGSLDEQSTADKVDIRLYPILLRVQSIPFGCETKGKDDEILKDLTIHALTEAICDEWMSALQDLHFQQLFVEVSMEQDHIPYPELCNSLVKACSSDSLDCFDILLNSKMLQSMYGFLKLAQPNGSIIMLQALTLRNCSVSDTVIHTVSQFINISPYLNSIDLSSNYISSKGVRILCEELIKCKHLKSLDISNNVLTDTFIESLVNVIATLSLQNLDCINLSRNRLSSKFAELLGSRLSNYQCKLRNIDLSYNDLGDKVGALIAMLLRNRPSQLQRCNLSFCGLTDASIVEIAKVIPLCSTLTMLNFTGIFADSISMSALIQAINQHHTNHSKSKNKLASNEENGLVCVVGGVIQDCQTSLSLRYRPLKSSLGAISDLSKIYEIAMNRRVLSPGGDEIVVNQAFSSLPTVCFYGEYAQHSLSLEDLSHYLADKLNCDLLQLQVSSVQVSRNGINSIKGFITYTIHGANLNRCYLSNAGKNGNVYVEHLMQLCKNHHASLQLLGIKSAFIQTSTESSELQISPIVVNVAIKPHRKVGTIHSSDSYVPIVASVDQFLTEFASNQSTNNTLMKRWGIIEEEVDSLHGDGAAFDCLDVEGENTDEQNYASWAEKENILREVRRINERLVLAVRRLYSIKEVSKKSARFWEGVLGNKKYRDFAENELLTAMIQVDAHMSADHNHNSNINNYLYPAIWKREQLYESMYARDSLLLAKNIQSLGSDKFSGNAGAVIGGFAFIYSQRLLNDINNLKLHFTNIKRICASFQELSIVEDFLLQCGRVAYTGLEMFEAVHLRQELIASGIKSPKYSHQVKEQLPFIQQKALLSNLLISRDWNVLRNKLAEIHLQINASDDQLANCEEVEVAKTLLGEYDQILTLLQTGSQQKSVEILDEALARAAYAYIYSEEVEYALRLLESCARNPARLLKPILEGLRGNNMSLVEKGFEDCMKMGLRHEALDAVICSKMHAIKNKIFQDDAVKDKLIKICLAIKNGFAVSAGEIMSVLRQAYAIRLNEDATLKPYFSVLSQHSKKYAGLQKQEKVIQQLITSNDIYKLSKLLSGRGFGKLVMSFPTAFARDQWYDKLSAVCQGIYAPQSMLAYQHTLTKTSIEIQHHDASDEKEAIIFQGIFEKAARSETGEIRGWRKRFFVLKSIHLSYYTKAQGDKKGAIRVLNGGVRKIDIHDAQNEVDAQIRNKFANRPFCIELEEGRDLSLISKDLLDEARRHVRLAKIQEIEFLLKYGIEKQSLVLLAKMLQFAKELEIMLDYSLMNEARRCVSVLRESQIRRQLYYAAFKEIPKSHQIKDLLQEAEKQHLEPNLPSLLFLNFLEQYGGGAQTCEQDLCRASVAFQNEHWSVFLSAMKSITGKVESIAFSTSDKSRLISLILQVLSVFSYRQVIEGHSSVHINRMCKQALSFVSSYHIESEGMDTIRLLIILFVRANIDIGTNKGNQNQGNIGNNYALNKDTSTDVNGFLSDICEYFSPSITNLKPRYHISKFPKLRLSSNSLHQRHGSLTAFLLGTPSQPQRRGSATSVGSGKEIMMFAKDALTKSLILHPLALGLQSNNSHSSSTASNNIVIQDYNNLCAESFLLLQIIMEDKPLTSITKSMHKKSKILSTFAWPLDIESCTFALVDLCYSDKMLFILSSQHEEYLIRDELYFQLCKQLTANDSQHSVVRGWLLMTVFLHAFAPTVDALPFLQHFVKQHKLTFAASSPNDVFTKTEESVDTSKEQVEEVRLVNQFCAKIASYCLQRLSVFENTAEVHKMRFPFYPRKRYGSEVYKKMLQLIFDQTPLPCRVVLFTGEVLHLDLPFSQLSTPQSVILNALQKLYPSSLLSYLRTRNERDGDEVDVGNNVELFNEYDLRQTNSSKGDIVERDFADSSAADHKLQHQYNSYLYSKYFLQDFALYSLGEDCFVSEEEDEREVIDFRKIPIQAKEGDLLSWQRDVQWDLLENCALASCPSSAGFAAQGKVPPVYLIRRRVVDIYESFDGDFALFGREIAARDSVLRNHEWREWIVNKEREVLPDDALRVDLIFSEDCRFVNSQLAFINKEHFHYLLAMHLAMSWFEESLEDTHVECIGVVPGVASVYFDHNNAPEGVSPYWKGVLKLTEQKAHVKHGTKKARTGLTVNELRTRQQAEHETTHDDSDSSSTSSSSSDDNVRARTYSSDSSSSSDSSYISQASTIEEEEYIPWTPKLIRAGQNMTTDDLEFLHRLLTSLGIPIPASSMMDETSSIATMSESSLQIDIVWEYMADFHQVAYEMKVDIKSFTFRYYMKRAYHEFLSAVCPFYGLYLLPATLDSVTADVGEATERATVYNSDILVGLSVFGLYLLSPSDWSIILSTPFWDISEYDVDIDEHGQQTLVLLINGLAVSLQLEKAEEVLNLIKDFSLYNNVKGYFPFGASALKSFDESANSHHNPSGSKEFMLHSHIHSLPTPNVQSFVEKYPVFPPPPFSTDYAKLVKKNPLFITIPKSKRELLAQERLEEEKVEQQMMRLAQESLIEKNQQQITRGREEMMQHQNNSNNDEEEDEEDMQRGGDEEKTSGQVKRKRHRSIFADKRGSILQKGGEELSAQMLQDRISTMVCGISTRGDIGFAEPHLLGKVEHILSSLPVRVGGKMKIPTKSSTNSDNLRLGPQIKSNNSTAVNISLDMVGACLSINSQPMSAAKKGQPSHQPPSNIVSALQGKWKDIKAKVAVDDGAERVDDLSLLHSQYYIPEVIQVDSEEADAANVPDIKVDNNAKYDPFLNGLKNVK